MLLWKRMKRALDVYLERLTAENKKMFGAGRPDCCKLNAKNTNKKWQ